MSKKKKLKTMDLILVILGMAILVFTVTMIVIFCKYQSIPDTLCTCFFAAVVGECGGMSWIKTTKERLTERKWQQEDEKKITTSQERAEL